jgi:hypothetical protein
VDRHHDHVDADPDPTFHFNADPDPDPYPIPSLHRKSFYLFLQNFDFGQYIGFSGKKYSLLFSFTFG